MFILQSALALEQDRLAVASGEVAENLVEIYRALGGAWQFRCQEYGLVTPVPLEEPAAVHSAD